MTNAIEGLHHAQITIPVGAEETGRAFYCDLLGLPEIPKPLALAGRGGFWLQVGALQVHIGTEAGVAREMTKAHLAYAVADVMAWCERLAAAGFAPLDGIPLPGYDRFECRDPFGNRLEFIGPRAEG